MEILRRQTAAFLVAGFGCVHIGYADHGPGTSGGGSQTQSAETLKPGKFAIDLRLDYTEFEDLSDTEIEAKAARAGSFDLLDRSFLPTISVSYGIVDNFQVGLSIGYYDAVKAREAEFDETSGETEIVTFDPDGITDLWLTAKYRFYRGPAGQFALFGGAKFPTGDHKVTNSEGERVEPSATAGTGSFDGMAGIAYSRFLTSQLTLDASGQYTFRTEHDDFRLGDRVDAGVAVAYRFTEDIQQFPQFSVFAEANVRHLFKSEEDGERDPNTGGTVLFLSPGFRVGFSPYAAFTVSPQFPVVQDLNGEQLETAFKVNAALTLSF
jgi:outer membrane putative beta-barrel porin/alpha-amylase